jgi:hypothetical protein
MILRNLVAALCAVFVWLGAGPTATAATTNDG